MLDKAKMDKMISESSNILITSHIGPDPDSISSALIVLWYIEKYHKDKEVTVTIEATPSDSLKIIPNFDKIDFVDELPSEINKVDLAILLDGNSMKRFTTNPDGVDQSKFKTICIDHHRSEGGDFDLTHIDPTAAAASQILAEDLVKEDLSDETLAKIILYGIAADTGIFRFTVPENARVLSITRTILEESGLNMQEIDLSLSTISEEVFHLYQILIANTHNVKLKNHPYNLTYTFLPKNLLGADYDKNMMSSANEVYNHTILRKIKDHPWGFIVTPREEGEFRLSFRSTPNNPKVRPIAESFDGGGHDMASGGSFYDEEDQFDSEEVCKKILERIEEMDLELVDV